MPCFRVSFLTWGAIGIRLQFWLISWNWFLNPWRAMVHITPPPPVRRRADRCGETSSVRRQWPEDARRSRHTWRTATTGWPAGEWAARLRDSLAAEKSLFRGILRVSSPVGWSLQGLEDDPDSFCTFECFQDGSHDGSQLFDISITQRGTNLPTYTTSGYPSDHQG